MIDSGSLHGKGGPAHAVEGAAHHGPTGTVYPGVGKRRVDEGGLVWGLWHQPPDGGQMAGALSGPRGGGVSRRPHTQPHQPAAAHVRGASRPPGGGVRFILETMPGLPRISSSSSVKPEVTKSRGTPVSSKVAMAPTLAPRSPGAVRRDRSPPPSRPGGGRISVSRPGA